MSGSNQDISVESTDLLTEISVAYYQDGQLRKKFPRSLPFRVPKWAEC